MRDEFEKMKQKVYFPKNNAGGFVLIISIVILLLLTIIGISATNMTSVELQISGIDKVHKNTFYNADGGTEIGMLMVEENISCPTGFDATGLDDTDPATFLTLRGIQVADNKFAYDELISNIPGSPATLDALPSDTARTIRIPMDIAAPNDTDPHTNIAIFGETKLATGSAIQMAAGYDGKGKGAGSSGAYIAYQIHSQHLGMRRSETILHIEWKHLVGQEGTCRYYN